MSLASFLLIIFTISSLFCIGLVLLAHNLSRFLRWSFTFSILSLIFWYACLYLSNLDFRYTLLFNRVVYAGPIVALVTYSLFLQAAFGATNQRSQRVNTLTAILAVPTLVLAVSPTNVHTVRPRFVGGHIAGFSIIPGPLNAFVIFGLLCLVMLLIYHSYVVYREVDAEARKPLRIICFGLAATLLVSTFTNLIAPSVQDGSNIANAISNFTTLAFVFTMSYCVLKYSFLNIRPYVVRAVAYLFTLLLITLFYLAPAIWIISRIVHVNITGPELALLVLFSLVLTLVYRYLRRTFDRLTRRLFLRDYYDAQDVLDKLGELLVRTQGASEVQSGARRILLEAIRTKTLDYWLETDAAGDQLKDLRRLYSQSKANVVVLQDSGLDRTLTEGLIERDIAVAVRLRTKQGPLGFMTLGFKDSGQAYTAQDKRLLSTAADEIAISLQNALHFQEIQLFNETLQANVTDATRKLRSTNEKLQALDATKDEFITMASHQLRTPLTSVKGYLSMVLEGDAGKLNKQQTQLLTQSYISAQRMVYLIADLLNLSRLNTGKFVIESTPVSLPEVVQGEIDQLRETAKARDIALNFEKPATFPNLMLDETKIHQVVMNFIDNAIYYTPAGGTIDVELRETPKSVEYTVKDNGIGVPKAEQHKLFAKFYRAANARQARPDGTGLGLFMARKVIAAQGGAIIFSSEEGKGSTFGFRFSKAKHAVPKNISEKLTA